MKTCFRYVVLMTVFFVVPSNAAPLAEKAAEAIVKYVAMGRNFSLLSADAAVGTVYSAPSTAASPHALNGVLNAAVPMSLEQHAVINGVGYSSREEQQYVVGTSLSQFVAEYLAEDLAERGISVVDFAAALRVAQIRFNVHRHYMAEPLSAFGMASHWQAGEWYLVSTQALSIGVEYYNSAAEFRLQRLVGEDALIENIVSYFSAGDATEPNMLAVKLEPVAYTEAVNVAVTQ